MIEGKSTSKHATHIRNAADIPAAYILIEGSSVNKQATHIRNAADIPVAYILIEGSSVNKQATYIGNAAGAASGGEAIVRPNIGGRPFGIFNTTYHADIANLVIGTENSHAIRMEGKNPFAYSIYQIVLRVTASATLYITIAIGAALAWCAVSTGIDRV